MPIKERAEAEIRGHADRLFDHIKVIFIDAEGLLDDSKRKQDCRWKLDEVDANKAQLMEQIKIKLAEAEAAVSDQDELKPEELLQLYHETTNRIQSLVERRNVRDEGIPAEPAEIKKRLEDILEQVLQGKLMLRATEGNRVRRALCATR